MTATDNRTDDLRATVPLPEAVMFALHALGHPDQLGGAVDDGRLEAMLRASAGHHLRTAGTPGGGTPDPATAVLAACAHLGAGGHEDAHIALRTALDFLPRPQS